jgi:hypothetical protein
LVVFFFEPVYFLSDVQLKGITCGRTHCVCFRPAVLYFEAQSHRDSPKPNTVVLNTKSYVHGPFFFVAKTGATDAHLAALRRFILFNDITVLKGDAEYSAFFM